ncbi:MAG: class I SAM-dependent methyltransferase [Candidatus Andersenbacteria bacterium]
MSQAAAELYDRRANLYEGFFVRLLGFGARVRRWCAQHVQLRAGLRVLDAACGPGTFTKALVELAREQNVEITLHAFDISQRQVDKLQTWVDTQHLTTVQVRRGDLVAASAPVATALPADWRNFDLIVCGYALEHVAPEQVPTALANLYARLAPHGRLVVSVTQQTPLTAWLVGRWWHARLLYVRAGAPGLAAAHLPVPTLSRLGTSRSIVAEVRRAG